LRSRQRSLSLFSLGEIARFPSQMSSQLNLLKALIRLLSLQYFIDIVLLIVNSPERVLLVFANSQPSLSAAAFSGLLSMCVRFAVYLILGIGFWTFAGPLARLLGKELLER
jgi:hypothetical protein